MAFWEGSFQVMHPLTPSTIMQLQLEDSEQLATNTYTKDTLGTDVVLSDCRMAQSFAMAVIRDGPVIRQEHQREDQIVRDREMARSLDDDAHRPYGHDNVFPLPQQIIVKNLRRV
ncbi:hypothetical protein LTR97_012635 [Elasticomyces elasticus]|uniref:Uncharacterized protein n=1 Tax=Elasticomyces elasticus TaxID=574655 RepID=A0AAN7VZI6_9PEZI|nr:hypothetical protein LTR97_012635 [Elasticomyces elasticus]